MLLTEASLTTTAPFLMQSHHVRHLLNALAKEKQKEKQKKTIPNNNASTSIKKRNATNRWELCGYGKNNTAQMLYRFSKHLGFVQSKRKRFALSPPKVEESITPTISILVLGNFPFPLSTLAFGEFQQQQRDAYGPQNREVLIGLQEMHRTKDELNKQLIEALKADAELLMRKYNGKLHDIEGWVDGCRARWQLVLSQSDEGSSFSEVERRALTQRILEEETLKGDVGHGLHNVLPLRNGGHPLTLRVDVVIDEEGQRSLQQRSSSSSSSPSRSQPLNSIEEGVYSTTTHCTLLEQVPTRRIAERSPKLSQ